MNEKLNIADIISKLNETEELVKNKNISAIDKDLILDKIRKIYESVISSSPEAITQEVIQPVRKIEEPKIVEKPVVEEKISEPVKVEKAPIEEKEEVIEKIDEVTETMVPILSEPEIFEEEPEFEDKKISVNPTLFDVESTIVKPENAETKKETKTPGKTIADQYQSHSGKTVSDLISKSQSEKDTVSKIQLKPIKSIKSAISINDRIMFTKELFDNDPDYYNEIVEKINSMKDLAEALEFLAVEVDIKEDSDTLKKFVELIHRRFA